MMQFSRIVSATGGNWVSKAGDVMINNLLIDSRSAFAAEGTLFFAIRGERHDGHEFVRQLYQKGIRNFILSHWPSGEESLPEANVVLVDDAVLALQKLAASHRSQFDIPVIGITGSNGKTVIKEWLWQLLSHDRNVARSPKSFNSQVGVPLSVWQLNNRHDLGIFEAGVSRPGEMERLEKILRPGIGIISNIGEAHMENFSSKRQLASEKLKLFANADVLIYCADYTDIVNELNENDSYTALKKISWSFGGKGDVNVTTVERGVKGSTIIAEFDGRPVTMQVPFRDDAALENVMNCWLTMVHLGYDHNKIAEYVQGLTAIAMRLEVKEGIHKCILVNDSYNSDLASLSVALDFLDQQKPGNRKTLILSDIYQSGREDRQLYEAVAQLIEVKKIDRLIGIGSHISSMSHLFRLENKSFYADTGEFLDKFQGSNFQSESILLKGARSFGFERISERLQQKAHETVLEVNLNALIGNYNYFKSLLPQGARLMVMVKAASYGVGSIEIASALQHNRVDYLGVAYADEGIHLREGGINVPIMVMNPEASAFDAMIRYRLEPELYNFRTLEQFRSALRSNNYYLEQEKSYPVHLKLDTGMYRLGFDEADLDRLITFLNENDQLIKVKSIFSHLSASDDPQKDEYSAAQIEHFRKMSDKIIDAIGYHADRHILNSNGILRFPEAIFDMVRLGIGLYGLVKEETHQRNLRPVSRLKTVVSQLRNVRKGARIGYDHRYEMPTDGVIATIPIGYADGLNRKLGNGAWKVKINGQEAPIVGNVCMDMCMVDVTGLQVNEGDAVTVFERREDLLKMAAVLETIPYELFTSISGRVKRVFYEE